MKKRKAGHILFISAMVIWLAVPAVAQNSQVLYYMNLPQNHLLNPAMRPTNSLSIILPGVGGMDFNISNNVVSYQNIFMPSGDTMLSILDEGFDVSRFLSGIRSTSSIEIKSQIPTFGIGFRAGKDLYINLDIIERIDGNFAIPGDLLRMKFGGNEDYLGKDIDMSSLRTDFSYYREIGLGFSKNVTERFRIGARFKYLMGVAAINLDNRALSLKVNNDLTHTITADMMLNISGPVTISLDQDNVIENVEFDDSHFNSASGIIKYLLNTGNSGLGFDLGAEYTIANKLRLSAAVTDFGYINWKQDITNLKADNQIVFKGFDMEDVYSGNVSIDSLAQAMIDTLMSAFSMTANATPFKTWLPYGVTFGANMNLTKSLSVGLVSYTRFVGTQVHQAVTLSGNLNIGNAFSATLAYTGANRRFDNVGMGLAFRAGITQFYFMADRLPLSWEKYKVEGKSIPLPSNWNTAHLRLGMNIVFGNRIKKKDDKPMVIVEQEEVIIK